MLRTGLAMMIVLLAATPASATLTAVHSAGAAGGAGTVTVTGDGGDDMLSVSASSGELTHNTLPGFNSDRDWDSTQPNDQPLPDSAGSALTVNSGGGADELDLDASVDLPVNVTYNAGGQPGDVLTAEVGSSVVDRVVNIGAGTITGLTAGTIATTNLATTTIRSGDGNDRFSILATPGARTDIFGQGGGDTLALGDGTSLNGGTFQGGESLNDTIDYSAFTTPVSVNLATTAHFSAPAFSGSQEV